MGESRTAGGKKWAAGLIEGKVLSPANLDPWNSPGYFKKLL